MKIHDSLTLGLLSTLKPIKHAPVTIRLTFKSTEPTPQYIQPLAYSTDGASIASFSHNPPFPQESFFSENSLTIWDFQTGGVVKEIHGLVFCCVSLLWSLDGSTIGIVGENEGNTYAIHTYHIASGTMHLHGTLQSSDEPHVWAHGTSFQILAAVETSEGYAISIFEVESTLTKIKSSYIGLWEDSHIRSFSPITHHISIGSSQCFAILDIQNSDCLLRQEGGTDCCCFSSDGSLFAAHFQGSIQIWKYSPGCYTPWRTLSFASGGYPNKLQFSPTLSSLLCLSKGVLHLWHLDDPLVSAHSDSYKPPAALSHCGGYTAVGGSDGTITITNLLSPNSSHIIDTGVAIENLTLTGNVLLVQKSETIMAWQLTKEGTVAGVSAGKKAGPNNTIWIVSLSSPEFYIWDHIVAIRGFNGEERVHHYYYPVSGRVLRLTQRVLPPIGPWFGYSDILCGDHNLHTHNLKISDTQVGCSKGVPQRIVQEGWVKDSEGKCQLWLPFEWRAYRQDWSCNSKALQLGREEGVIIRF